MKEQDRYEQYLKSISPDKKLAQSRDSSTLGSIIKIGAAVAGVVTIKKSGILETAMKPLVSKMVPTLAKTRPLFETANAFNRATDEVLKSRGIGTLFSDQAIDELGSIFSRNLKQTAMAEESMFFERAIIGRVSEKKNILRAIADEHRYQHISRGVTGSVPLRTGEPILEEILKGLEAKRAHTGFFAKVDKDELGRVVQKMNLSAEQKEIAYDVISANINKYEPYFNVGGRGTKFLLPRETGSPTMGDIRRQLIEAQEVLDEGIIQNTKKRQDFLTRLYSDKGMRPLTVKDALDKNLFKTELRPKAVYEGRERSATLEAIDYNLKIRNMANRRYLKSKEAGDSFMGLPVDPRVFIDAKGDIHDLRHLTKMKENALNHWASDYQIPLVNINLIRMSHWYTRQGVKNAPVSQLFKAGVEKPFIEDGAGRKWHNVLQSGGYTYDMTTREIIRTDSYLMSGRHGLGPRMTNSLMGFEREEIQRIREKDTGITGFFKKLFDIGYQDVESDLRKGASVFTKWKDPRYAPTAIDNLVQAFRTGEIDVEKAKEAYGSIYSTIKNKSESLSPISMRKLAELELPTGGTLADKYGLTSSDFEVRSREEILTLFQKIMSREHRSELYKDSPVLDVMYKYLRELSDIRTFEDTYHTVSGGATLAPGVQAFFEGGNTAKLVSRYDDLVKAIQMDMIYQGDVAYRANAGSSIIDGLTHFRKEELNSIKDMKLLNMLHGESNNIFQRIERGDVIDIEAGVKTFFKTFFQDRIAGDQPMKDLAVAVSRHSPILGSGPGIKPEMYADSPYIIMNKTKPFLQSFNEGIKEGKTWLGGIQNALGTWFRQAGFGPGRAGRNNPEEVSALTFAFQFFGTRLNDAIAHGAGIGLSNKFLSSPQDSLVNLIGRRYYLPLIVGGYLQYGDYLTETLTGVSPRDTFLDAYAGATLKTAEIKDLMGLNKISKRVGSLIAGGDQINEWTPSKLLKYGTFGLLGDSRSKKELEDYYTKGYDPIYQGRWWGVGSMTPWAGSRIKFHLPSWYRLTKSEYKMTDVMYGSEKEYWANSPLITPHNPLGPIKTLLLDPHHWYNKHMEDRPYPTSGGPTLLEEVPLVGPLASNILDTTGIINSKKRRDLSKAHRDYIREINDQIKARKEAAPDYLRITPGGSMKFLDNVGGQHDYGLRRGSSGWDGYYVSSGASGGYVDLRAQGQEYPILNARDYSRGELRKINEDIRRKAISKSRLKDFKYRNETVEREFGNDFFTIDSMMNTESISHRLRETIYTTTEMAGFYGFSAALPFGGNDPDWSNKLASASYISSFGRNWWDREIGGLGAMANEIGRRFFPRNTMRRDAYNPYRNQMPDWLPGVGHYIDFQHGDSFSKIPYGEVRLPGAGYEKVHKLHSDELGKYGVVDRFMILGDVAPYSEEYRYYKSLIPNLNLDEETKEEIKASLKRTGDAKKKHRITPYRFKDAKIEKKDVTITQVIDDTTFLTAEFPDNPIRLAGIKLNKTKDPDAYEQAKAQIAEVIKYGNKVTIGIDANENNRINKDVMNTISGAVFLKGDDAGRTLQRTLLASDNPAVLEKENDYSPAAAFARFEKAEIDFGATWEKIVHLDNPIMNKFLRVRSALEVYERKEIYGKCITGDTLIQTSSGVKQAKEVVVGDEIKTHTGKNAIVGEVTISNVYDVSKESQIYNIICGTAQYFPLRTTAEHPILVFKDNNCVIPSRTNRSCNHEKCTRKKDCIYLKPAPTSPEWIEASSLKVGDYVAYPKFKFHNEVTIDVLELLKNELPLKDIDGFLYLVDKNGRKTRSRKFPRFLDLDKDFYRLCGYWLAEGSLGRYKGKIEGVNFGFNINEVEYIEDVKKILEKYNIRSYIDKSIEDNCSTIRIKSRILGELFFKLLGEKKKKHISKTLLESSKENLASLILGYWRGDGHCKTGVKPYAMATSVCLDLLVQVRNILTGFDIVAAIGLHSKTGTSKIKGYTQTKDAYTLSVSGKQTESLFKMLELAFEHTVTRDSAYVKTFEDYVAIKVLDIQKEEYDGKVYDFGVLDEDHSFCTIAHAIHNSFQPWEKPISGLIVPTLESFARDMPVIAALETGILGSLFRGSPGGRLKGFIAGATLGASLSTARVMNETITGETWIPKRRRKEREINEYFDVLEYVKYRGLYEKTRRIAIKEEGVDVAKVIEARNRQKYQNKREKRMLSGFKRWMYLEKSNENKRMTKQANAELRGIQARDGLIKLGPIAMQALQYEERSRMTLYGLKPGDEITKIYAALPSKEREFFQHFMDAPDFEKKRILDVTPKNQRKFLQAKWGLKVDKDPSLKEFFKKHPLPGPEWAGWSANVKLDDVKIKVIQNEALDLTEFGYWKDDIKYGELAPDIETPLIATKTLKRRLSSVLRGSGLKDVDVNITRRPSKEPTSISLNMDLFENTQEEFKSILNDMTVFNIM